MKVKLSNRLGTYPKRGNGAGNNAREMVVFYVARYLFFDCDCGCVLVRVLVRIMGCVGSINASQTSVMNDLMFLFVIERRYDLRAQQTNSTTRLPGRGPNVRRWKKSPIIVLISLFSCAPRRPGDDRSLWHDLWTRAVPKKEKNIYITRNQSLATTFVLCSLHHHELG